MKKRKESKEEKERRALFNQIKAKLLLMRAYLRISLINYPEVTESDENTLFELIKGLREMERIFFDLLLEGMSGKEIRHERKEMIGKWPVQSTP